MNMGCILNTDFTEFFEGELRKVVEIVQKREHINAPRYNDVFLHFLYTPKTHTYINTYTHTHRVSVYFYYVA